MKNLFSETATPNFGPVILCLMVFATVGVGGCDAFKPEAAKPRKSSVETTEPQEPAASDSVSSTAGDARTDDVRAKQAMKAFSEAMAPAQEAASISSDVGISLPPTPEVESKNAMDSDAVKADAEKADAEKADVEKADVAAVGKKEPDIALRPAATDSAGGDATAGQSSAAYESKTPASGSTVASDLTDQSEPTVEPGPKTEMVESPRKKKKSRKKSKRDEFQSTFLAWNVESEGSDPQTIADQLAELPRYDVYALCEVLPEAAPLFHKALGKDYRYVISESGYNDRLQIIFNADVYELVRFYELKEINFENRYRSPLVAEFRHRASKTELIVMNNHLARGRANVREQQATQLVEWARKQLVGVIALGDYNFDFEFASRKGNDGFVNMMKDNVWQWIEPEELIDSNWYDSPSHPDGRDDFPGSILDFAFVTGPAKAWKKACRVIVRPGDFPDNDRTSDHRPIEVMLKK